MSILGITIADARNLYDQEIRALHEDANKLPHSERECFIDKIVSIASEIKVALDETHLRARMKEKNSAQCIRRPDHNAFMSRFTALRSECHLPKAPKEDVQKIENSVVGELLLREVDQEKSGRASAIKECLEGTQVEESEESVEWRLTAIYFGVISEAILNLNDRSKSVEAKRIAEKYIDPEYNIDPEKSVALEDCKKLFEIFSRGADDSFAVSGKIVVSILLMIEELNFSALAAAREILDPDSIDSEEAQFTAKESYSLGESRKLIALLPSERE